MRTWFDIERIIHSTKTAIACILGILLAKLVGFPAGTWVVVTIIVVMCGQIFVGSVIIKGALRFFGALLGSIFALMTLFIAGDDFASIVITMAFAGFFFSYLATINETFVYPGTFGAVTTAVILLGPIHTVEFAMGRFLEISTGILIATLVSQFVLPIHARTHLQRGQAKLLGLLKDYYITCMEHDSSESASRRLEDLDEELIKLFSRQRQLAKEAAREPLGISYDRRVFLKSLTCEREILRAIDLIHQALKNIKDWRTLFKDQQILTDFNNMIVSNFDLLIKNVEGDETAAETMQFKIHTNLKQQIEKNRYDALKTDWFYIDGFLFATEMLVSNLKTLATLNHISVIDQPPTETLPNQ